MIDRRDEFLLEMYRQASSHLNRHILVVWQSVGVVAGALAVLAFGDKPPSGLQARFDFVIAILSLLSAWLLAHLIDANQWFNRNLHIITNIERQFLRPTDAKEIHYLFLKHRLERRSETPRAWRLTGFIAHLEIQLLLGMGLWIMVLFYHFYERVLPGVWLPWSNFDPVRALPYLISVAGILYCTWLKGDRSKDGERLKERSPGLDVRVA